MSYNPYGPPSPRTYDNRLEAVVVCVNYGDFLNETLPLNLPHIDRLVVVTTLNDQVTRAVCRKWSVECVTTDVFTEKGDCFNKGAAINVGLASLRQKGWLLHMDADIALPITFRNMLDKSALRDDCIYGCERACVCGWDQWQKIKADWLNQPQYCQKYFVMTPAETPISPNIVHKHLGFVPIGFFQLWHSKFMQYNEIRYPETESNAENMDVQFAIKWPRQNRLLLPTIRVYHIESESGPMGINWNGRKSKPFTPDGKPLDAGLNAWRPGYGGDGY